MREEQLRQYFLGKVSANELAEDVYGSVVQVDDVISTVQITDMRDSFLLIRPHIVRLCDDFLNRALSPEALNTVAFALMASDTFEWDDDVISEVLSDWSAPEINYELNGETISMHRQWLLGSTKPSHREAASPHATATGHLIFSRTKASG